MNSDKMHLVKFQNDWETHIYWVNKKRVELLKVTIKDKEYVVFKKPILVPYSDHGHKYEARSLHHLILSELDTLIDLSQVPHKIYVKEGDYIGI